MKFPTEELNEWFRQHRRDFPWREDPTPYRVWISEVMLQQTQASTVIPFFERFMEAFPTLPDLAAAPLERVIKMWEGLGYYSRVRHIHAAAQEIVAEHGGEFPEQLEGIKGIGPYTQGAIRSFALKQKAAALDGNVMRVLSRFFAIEEEVDRIPIRKKLQELAFSLLPETEPWVVSEGLIELGALVCKKVPRCCACPLQRECRAYRLGLASSLPKKKPRPKTVLLERDVGVIFHGEALLLQKGERGKVMSDLYEFPYVEAKGTPQHSLEEALGLKLRLLSSLPEQKQTFTRYRVRLYPHLFVSTEKDRRFLWKEKHELATLPFSSGHKRILNQL